MQVNNLSPVSSYLPEPLKEKTALALPTAAASSSHPLPFSRPHWELKSSEQAEEGNSCDRDSAYGSTTNLRQHRPGYSAGKKVRATVHKSELWQLFSGIGNEMIVTKPGR